MITLEIQDNIALVTLDRPEKSNAIDEAGWPELLRLFTAVHEDTAVRVIILQGNGKNFCAGIDLAMLMSIRQAVSDSCEGRLRDKLRRLILQLQAPINAIDQCAKPVLAAVQGGCIGAGVDIIAATDMRYCTADAYFSIKEIDMGMVADLGTLQRLPRLMPAGLVRELAYTGRKLTAQEALAAGLVNGVWADKGAMDTAVYDIAQQIASKSPLAIRGTKEVLNYSRDHTIADSLQQIALWNAALLLSDDLNEAFMATMQKRPPVFRD
jgi:enoyl-CoA hydratase